MKRAVIAIMLVLAPSLAAAQTQTGAPQQAATDERPASGLALRPIEPANALERAFVSALTNAEMRPVFRRQLLESHIALALTSDAPDAAPLEIPLREGVSASMLFTSAERLNTILGPNAPRAIMTGRAALERLRGKNVILNARLMPMLTLEPEDVARYLETPASPASAGPTQ